MMMPHACLNFALNILCKEIDNSQFPPLSQHSLVEHPLDDPTTYLPSTALFDALCLSLACLGELENLIQLPLHKRLDEEYSAYGAASIDTFIKTGVIDYLAELSNPSEGIPADELASTFGLDSQKLVPILRCCASNGWILIVQLGPGGNLREISRSIWNKWEKFEINARALSAKATCDDFLVISKTEVDRP
ncbi:hypothetical protein BDR07DRAFT_1463341 [Suillus spraguei]|nr:hypothetical protein BDR07DRAFT_1463341 [Suillus spraguei]